MKIVGNNKDYYDGVAAQFGPSSDVIYNRVSELLISRQLDRRIESDIPDIKLPSVERYDRERILIGFCGKIYRLEISVGGFEKPTQTFYYDHEGDRKRMMEIYNKTKELSYKDQQKEPLYGSSIKFAANLGQRKIDWWDSHHGLSEGCFNVVEDHNIFQDLGCPIFLYVKGHMYYHDSMRPTFIARSEDRILAGMPKRTREGETYINSYLIKNPSLIDFGFQKMVDPYTAVQEIEMYIGRLAVNNTPPMPVGSDKVIAESKGFDKYSFRKPPTKKR